jgi:hypothetical protein
VLVMINLLALHVRNQTPRTRDAWMHLLHVTRPETKLKILIGFCASAGLDPSASG